MQAGKVAMPENTRQSYIAYLPLVLHFDELNQTLAQLSDVQLVPPPPRELVCSHADSDSLAPCSQNYNSGQVSWVHSESGTLQNFSRDCKSTMF